jgi:tetratricopeptide (TPR) repeat protein
LMLARVKWQQGQFQEALFLNHEAKLRYERYGVRSGLAKVANTQGEILRTLGDFEGAEEAYRESVRRYESSGSRSTYPRLNLAITLAERGAFEEALEGMNSVLQEVEKRDIGVVCAVRAIRLYPMSMLHCWSEIEQELDDLTEPLLAGAFTDSDVARFCQKAAGICAEQGCVASALRLWRIALRQWTALERDAEREEVAHLLSAYSGDIEKLSSEESSPKASS